MMNTNASREPEISPVSQGLLYGLIFGVALGLLFSVAAGDLAFYAIGIGIGLVLGAAIGAMLQEDNNGPDQRRSM